MVCDFSVRIPKVKSRKFKPRIRTWKLKDPAIANQFCDAFRTNVTRAAAENNSGDAVENAWSKLKDPLLCAATAVCGLSKNHQWRPETWWWNDRVEDAVKEKRIRYKAYNALKKAGKVVEAKEAKTAYNEAKRVAKRVVWLAKSEDERGYLPTSPLLVMASFG